MNPTDDYPTLTPYLAMQGAAKAIDFYKAAFGAEERYHLSSSDGKIGHCEMTIGGQCFMLSEEWPGMSKSPTTLGGVSTKFVLIVPSCDDALQRALGAGAKQIMPPCDMFYGWRCASVRDPFGHEWLLQHQIEKLTPQQMQERWDAMTGQDCSGAK